MTDAVKAIRKDIVRKFCRTVLWIDDEIDLANGLNACNPMFAKKMKEFADVGLLCHLSGFPTVRPGTDPYAEPEEVTAAIENAVPLACQAEVVLIDWELGTRDSSDHAVKIIKKLIGEQQGFRFVVILSKNEPADNAFTNIDSTFTVISGDGCLWRNASGQFLLSIRKDEFEAKNLFDSLCDYLLAAYPDYLHLAALEIAGRIKEYAPRWLSAIPSNTDVGILVERGNTITEDSDAWHVDIQDCVTTNLMEDLETAVMSENLRVLQCEGLKPSNSSVDSKIFNYNPVDNELKNSIGALVGCLKDEGSQKFQKSKYENLSEHRDDEVVAQIVKSIEAYTEFCEKRSGTSLVGNRLCPGAIYKGLTGNTDEVAVCITAGCDCLRSPSLLFLVGSPMPSKMVGESPIPDYKALRNQKGGKTVLRFCGNSYVFRSAASTVLVKTREALSEGRVIGVVRQDLLNRLISRFMSQTQRFAVNQPALVRKLREDGGLDE